MWDQRPPKRPVSGLAIAGLLLLAAACSDGPDEVSPGAEVSSSPTSSSPTATGTKPLSDAELASEAAVTAVRTYYAVRDDLRKNPEESLDRLKAVAVSTELAALRNLLKRERRDGLRQTGDTKITELTVQTVSLDNSDPHGGKVPTVQVEVCYDVSGADLLDMDGKSVVSSDRRATGWIRYSVSNYEWESDPAAAWRVASSEDLKRTPCAAS